MTNEQKLWQRRAGILSEGEYMKSMEEAELELGPTAQPASGADAEDPNVKALLAYIQSKTGNLKPIDTVVELKKLVNALIQKIQDLNKDGLSDQEVAMAMRQFSTEKNKQATQAK